jgi:hypothetical protein
MAGVGGIAVLIIPMKASAAAHWIEGARSAHHSQSAEALVVAALALTRRRGLIPNLKIETPRLSALNSKPSTLNLQPSTLNPQPRTLDPRPWTLDPRS